MAIGILIIIASVIGVVKGITKKDILLTIVSLIALMMIIAVWVYFYNNPY